MAKPTTLSKTAQAVLTAAAGHEDRAAFAPDRLPAATWRAIARSLLKAGLLGEITAVDDQPAWRTAENGDRFALRLTDEGCRAAGIEPSGGDLSVPAQEGPPGAEAAQEAQQRPTPPTATQEAPSAPLLPTRCRETLRCAALAVLAAWDSAAEASPALPAAVDGLRAALATTRAARAPCGAPRQPRTDTKQATVLALLRRPEGASGPAMAEATGWAPHTVRGFLAGLAKKGITVTVLDRVRQVGAGKQGTKGSYTVYRVTEAS